MGRITRPKLMRLVIARGHNGMRVREISRALDLPKSTNENIINLIEDLQRRRKDFCETRAGSRKAPPVHLNNSFRFWNTRSYFWSQTIHKQVATQKLTDMVPKQISIFGDGLAKDKFNKIFERERWIRDVMISFGCWWDPGIGLRSSLQLERLKIRVCSK